MAIAAQAVVCEEFGGPEVLQLKDVELRALGPGEVQVAIAAAGVNPSDTYMRLGPHGPWASNPSALPTPPFTCGKDGAGVVVAVGEGVINVVVGQRVYLAGSRTGTYATAAICDPATVHPLPEGISFEQGACVGVPCATAFHALVHRARVQRNQRVFVHGASGAVGLAAVQLAKDMGCFVVGTAGTAAGEEAVRAAGADAVFCHRKEGYLTELKAVLPAGGFDVVLEMAAHLNLSAAVGLAGKRGCVLIIGSKAEAHAFNPRLTMVPEVDVRGVFLGSATPEEMREIHAGLQDAMARGALTPHVGMRLAFADAPRAHVEVMAPSAGGAVGNIVLLPPAHATSAM
eukprot:NODE_11732_length_1268_cov_5.656442.p1 GENE.NODE_11732_length_1268_cov_5.656442~~NODE_11732_length_1268_cov_5.656442.p1  ORF type:complete len:375 (+),score=142.60 NODE_11732_length_1268_cov_5.656442:94-1125(+)